MPYKFADICSQAVSKVQWKTPDDGQRNCSKHVGFYSKNKFEKLVHLVGFAMRIYHDARSSERQILQYPLFSCSQLSNTIITAYGLLVADFLLLSTSHMDTTETKKHKRENK